MSCGQDGKSFSENWRGQLEMDLWGSIWHFPGLRLRKVCSRNGERDKLESCVCERFSTVPHLQSRIPVCLSHLVCCLPKSFPQPPIHTWHSSTAKRRSVTAVTATPSMVRCKPVVSSKALMKSKVDVAGSCSERVLCYGRGRKRMTCPSELSWLVCFLRIFDTISTWCPVPSFVPSCTCE